MKYIADKYFAITAIMFVKNVIVLTAWLLSLLLFFDIQLSTFIYNIYTKAQVKSFVCFYGY